MAYMIDEGTVVFIRYKGGTASVQSTTAAQFKMGDPFIIVKDKDGDLNWINIDSVSGIRYKGEKEYNNLPDGYKPIPGTFQKSDNMGGF